MEIDSKRFEEIARLIHSDASPVGIDAKKTHVLILAMLQDLQERVAGLEKQLESLTNQTRSD
ncbi:MAG: hypothetical protein ACR2NP_21230 [Pirellulaceae bacterium]